jgi:hypothetical protein
MSPLLHGNTANTGRACREVVILPALADGGERFFNIFFLLFPPFNYCLADRHK